ncbi:helicase-exonuclease AddAB subunit AddB [Paenibacillus psychroresistens]|uniref:ATP-dependent helicase/deoxyribonuclease subunit B n=1 Tax=Paenibacillus psychroresistens TaxID=1778678 RepID=A0A6B8RIZ6_9BACL|nr:helicase-exonuclease AddAB subunit AddB [Paenibacillus psychroresistens]QGQ95714.1 helicase-exonuclease AddAB subunit AddB [Paenibacillus psychroresistens]
MAIRFIIGRAGSGKSRRCLDEIRQQLADNPQGNPLILLVPEQATFQAEVALVSTPGLSGIIRAQVLSFRRLAWRVMQETGDTAKLPIDDIGKIMLLQRILHKHDAELKLFQSSQEKMGFLERLNAFFSELKRYCITADVLKDYYAKKIISKEIEGSTSLLADKLHDLLVLYSEFEKLLALQYLDGEDYLANLAKQLQKSTGVCEADLWIDGFFGFTPQEQEAVLQCMRYCRSVTITLCLDRAYSVGERPDELNLFHPTAVTMVRLQEQLEALGMFTNEVVVLGENELPRFRKSPMLAHLERNYEQRLSPRRKHYPAVAEEALNESIHLYAAVHRRAEVEGAAREIRRVVREKHLRWRDIAVRVRNIEAYGDLLASVFDDYSIPYFFDQKSTMMFHPLVEFIRSALEVVLHNWQSDAVFRCVKTDFLLPLNKESSGIVDRKAMDELENYVLAYGIQGYRWLEAKSWEIRRFNSLEDEEATAKDEDTLALKRIQASSQLIIKPLSQLQQRMKQSETLQQRTEALYTMLSDSGVPERLQQWGDEALAAGNPQKAREHSQVWDHVMNMLDQMVEMMGAEEVSLELFVQLLDAGLESIRLALVPPSLDQILIGSIDRTRTAQVKIAFVLGVNDGVLPQRMNEDGLISENERELLSELGLHLADGSRRKLLDEQFLIYTVLCAPSDYLWLSYPLADEEGKSLLPSEIIKQVKSLFPLMQERLLLAGPEGSLSEQAQMSFIAQPERALSYLTVQMKLALRGAEIAPLWWHIYNWFAVQADWRDKLQRMMRSLLFTNSEPALAETTRVQLYGDHLRASVSRMERFVACPFSQFVSHGLRLQERRIYRLEAPDIGQLYHAALNALVKDMQQEGVLWGMLSLEQLTERASLIIDRLTPRLQSEILLSSARYRYIAFKLKNIIGRAAVMLAEHVRRGAFVPVELELGFGPGQTLPALSFQLNNGFAMDIIGRIDRVDRAEGAEGALLRIIDYKSSSTSLKLAEVYHGLSLQMLTYLDVVITHAERWIGQKAIPAGVLYFHVHNPMIQSKNALQSEEVEKELKKRFKTRGLVLAETEAIGFMDHDLSGGSGRSSIIPVALKNDGSFYKNASVATRAEWSLLQSHVRQTIRVIGTRITNGEVSVEPYRMGEQIACTFCNYKSICEFDPLFAGNDYRIIQPRSNEQVWQAMALDIAGESVMDIPLKQKGVQ